MTDGESRDGDVVRENALKLHEGNVSLYAIGIGEASMDELILITGDEQNGMSLKAINRILRKKRPGRFLNQY